MLLALAITFAVTGITSWCLATTRGQWLVLDIPNKRSLHTQPTPRTGGIAILLGTAMGLLTVWLWNGYTVVSLPLATAVLVLALVALLDDRHTLGAGPRLLTQICMVSLLLFTQRLDVSGSLTLVVTLLFLVWMINLYNFMDGMDGFAGGMAVIGFGTFALIAWQAGNIDLALGCALIVSACSGFLLLNFPPAQLFMGDTGSTVLGLLAGVVILSAHNKAILPVWLGILVFSPFIVDASVTLTTRVLRGEKFWQAHKTHYYQRLVQIGWGHKRTVLAEYALMIACGGTAAAASQQPLPRQVIIIAGWAVIYATLIYLIHRAEQHREPQT